jgi:tetraprenyl-beta-curcumene synthase
LIRSPLPHLTVPRDPVTLMLRIYRYVLPGVHAELREWRRKAEQIPDAELRRQAIASMTTKQFHCEGGAAYAAACLPQRHLLIRLIVAFQTISDYLDNLCDRSTSLDAADFRCLHQSMLDAVDPAAPLIDYYALHPEKEDGGYLADLVRTCQSCLARLPSYPVAQPFARELVSLYGDLQVYKHIRPDQREKELLAWWERHQAAYSELRWNEFAAATGSTLGDFMLFLSAARPGLEPAAAARIRQAYFPFVCGLHILLDYLIDQEEDRLGADLNFCRYYDSPEQTAERIGFIVERAREAVQALEHPAFHRMIIEGLLALYLSDPKVARQPRVRQVSRQLMRNSPLTRLFFWGNGIWIRLRS